MPRSGTTLVESIIASAPNVISGGELVSFHDLVSSSFDDDPEIENVENPGKVYLNRMVLEVKRNFLLINFRAIIILLVISIIFSLKLKLFI